MTAPIAPERSSLDVREEEILRRLAEHADDTIPCEFHGAPATWRLSMRCCGSDAFMCQAHRDRVRDGFALHNPRARPRCTECQHRFPVGAPYADVVREVTL